MRVTTGCRHAALSCATLARERRKQARASGGRREGCGPSTATTPAAAAEAKGKRAAAFLSKLADWMGPCMEVAIA